MKKSIFYLSSFAAYGAGHILTQGIVGILDYYSTINSINQAVYQHADKITPEIIEQANELVSKVGIYPAATATVCIGVSFSILTAIACALLGKKIENKEDKNEPRIN